MFKYSRNKIIVIHFAWWILVGLRIIYYGKDYSAVPEFILLLSFFYTNYLLVSNYKSYKNITLRDVLINGIGFLIIYFISVTLLSQHLRLMVASDIELPTIAKQSITIVEKGLFLWASSIGAYLMIVYWKGLSIIATLEHDIKETQHKNRLNTFNTSMFDNVINHLENKKGNISEEISNLSNIIEYKLYYNQKDKIQFKEEEKQINNYLNLYKETTSIEVEYRTKINGETTISPQSLLVNIEDILNEIKGIQKVRIEINQQKNSVVLSIKIISSIKEQNYTSKYYEIDFSQHDRLITIVTKVPILSSNK